VPGPAVRRMSRDDRRASLVAAAGRLVAGAPGERLTFEAIAAEAGVSATLPYKYFDAVDDVALELYTSLVDDVDAATDEILAGDRPFDDKVRAAVLLWCALVERDDFLFVRLAEGANAAGLARAVHRRRERTVAVWAPPIAREFGLSEAHARLAAASMVASAGAAIQRIFADRLDRDEVADLVVRMARAQCAAMVLPAPAARQRAAVSASSRARSSAKR
jgi:AcrR family transcriptional regulator